MKMDGYVIVPPINKWDEKHRELIITHSSYNTFGKNAVEAWLRFTGHHYADPDRSAKIQYWHDKGYRVKKATLEIIDDRPN